MVSTPLKHVSQLGLLFPVYGKIKNVPNHQPVEGLRVKPLTNAWSMQLQASHSSKLALDTAQSTADLAPATKTRRPVPAGHSGLKHGELETHGKTMGKSWENGGFIGINGV